MPPPQPPAERSLSALRCAADSTSVNLFKLAAGALSLRPGRTTILSEAGNFPTDLYALQGLADLLGPERARLNAVAPAPETTKTVTTGPTWVTVPQAAPVPE